MHRSASMRACTGRKRVLLVLSSMCALVVPAGCDDDATGPPPSADPWSEIRLPADLDGGSILDLAFGPGRKLVLGYRRIDSDPGVFPAVLPVLLEFGSRGWTDVTPELLGPRMLPLAVTLIDGAAVVVGADDELSPLILEERDGWNRIRSEAPPFSYLSAVLAGWGGTLRAVGVSEQGLAFESSAANEWFAEPTGFETDPNDKGLTDLAYASGTFYGVGFDDAGPPFRVVMRNEGDGWIQLDFLPARAQSLELEAIAASGSGNLWVGGAMVETPGGGSQSYEAWLAGRDSDGNWFQIVLPHAQELQRVNDILVASDDTVYLACGLDRMGIVRASRSGRISREGPELAGRLLTLAEDADGSVYASGYAQLEPRGPRRPLILRRRR